VLTRFLLRVGYVALGAVYVTLGVVAARVAILGRHTDVGGFSAAYRFLLSRPHGPAIVASIAAGLTAFAFAKIIEAWNPHRTLVARAGALLDAVAHGALAWIALALLLRLRQGAPVSRPALAWLFSQTWGPTALEAVGVAVIAGGAVQIWRAASGRLRERLSRRLRSITPLIVAFARFGLAARGTVSVIIGWFLIRAAVDLDPSDVRAIGGALDVLHKTRAGPFLLLAAGAGLGAYGFYLVLLAFFRRIP
jgi:uncharacterized protein DUF1206